MSNHDTRPPPRWDPSRGLRVHAPGDRPHRRPDWDPRADLPLPVAAVATAERELRAGVREIRKTNRGRRVEMYQGAAGIPPGSPWCAAFVNWCAEEAGKVLGVRSPLEDVPLEGYVQSYVNHGRKHGWEIPYEKIGPGDLFCLWFGSLGRYGHIGFVRWRDVEEGNLYYYTIEGNTSKDPSSPAEERDSVWVAGRRRRADSRAGSRGNPRVVFLRWSE